MAALNELIDKIENPELRAQIHEAANKLAKQKKFGLVFEEHLTEITSSCPFGRYNSRICCLARSRVLRR